MSYHKHLLWILWAIALVFSHLLSGREYRVNTPHSLSTHTLSAQSRQDQVQPLPIKQDKQELHTFYQQNLGLIYRYVYSKVGNREEAEDLTSQIFLKAVRGIDQTRDQQSLQKWLFQVARTTIADYWRIYYRATVDSLDALVEAGWQGPIAEEELAVATSPIDHVQYILQSLPEHYREVLSCRFLLNLSIKETALRLGLSEANVKVLQFRALKRAAELASTSHEI